MGISHVLPRGHVRCRKKMIVASSVSDGYDCCGFVYVVSESPAAIVRMTC